MKDINLLPEDIKTSSGEKTALNSEKMEFSKGKVIIVILILILAIALLFSPTAIFKIMELNANSIKAEINSQAYSEVKAVNGQLMNVNAKLNGKYAVLKDIDNNTYPVNELLNEVRQAAPKGCVISSLKFDEGKVMISGAATDSMVIAEFISNIERLDIFTNLGVGAGLTYQRTNSVQKFQLSFNVGRKDGK